jgi:hypothetical protein
VRALSTGHAGLPSFGNNNNNESSEQYSTKAFENDKNCLSDGRYQAKCKINGSRAIDLDTIELYEVSLNL